MRWNGPKVRNMTIKRVWGVRHVRWAWLSWRFWSWWNAIGHYMGAFPSPADLAYLTSVWRGDA